MRESIPTCFTYHCRNWRISELLIHSRQANYENHRKCEPGESAQRTRQSWRGKTCGGKTRRQQSKSMWMPSAYVICHSKPYRANYQTPKSLNFINRIAWARLPAVRVCESVWSRHNRLPVRISLYLRRLIRAVLHTNILRCNLRYRRSLAAITTHSFFSIQFYHFIFVLSNVNEPKWFRTKWVIDSKFTRRSRRHLLCFCFAFPRTING